MAYLVSLIGSDGGREQREKSVFGLSSTALNSSPAPVARARHERQLGIDLPDQPERRGALRAARKISSVVSVLQLRLVAGDAVDDALATNWCDDIEPARQQIGRRNGL